MRLVDRYTYRGIGYAIFSIIVEREPVVVIVDDDQAKELFSILLEDIWDNYERRKTPTSDIKLANFDVITKEEYFKKWKEYAGKRLVFVYDDRYLFCPGLDILERIVEDIVVSKTRDPIGRLVVRIVDILTSLELARDYYKDFKAGKIDSKKLISTLEKRFPKKDDAHLLIEILRSFN